jgi:hypothetical protein
MLAKVDHKLLATREVHPHTLATTTRCLRKMLGPLVMHPMVTAMMLCTVVPKIVLVQLGVKGMRCDEGFHI